MHNGKTGQLSHVYNVYDFGAKGDGITNDQKAIQKAINTCGKTGGTVFLKKENSYRAITVS